MTAEVLRTLATEHASHALRFLREEAAFAASVAMPGSDLFGVDRAEAARMTRTNGRCPPDPFDPSSGGSKPQAASC